MHNGQRINNTLSALLWLQWSKIDADKNDKIICIIYAIKRNKTRKNQ